MKLHNILLSFLLVFQIVYANDENKNIFEYNYHCVKDNNNLCSKLQEKVTEATDSLSRVLDVSSKIKFEVFVDDISKYRADRTKETLAVALDTKFEPLNPEDSNIISPYPNAKALKKKLNLKKDEEVKGRDFILLLNSFKSDKKYVEKLQDETTLIIIEIFEGLMSLEKLSYPYLKDSYQVETNDKSFTEDPTPIYVAGLVMRNDPDLINNTAMDNEKKFKKFSESNKLPDIIHWKDTLLGEGTKHFQKKSYEYKRIIAIGDIHGDYDKLESTLRHAKLIDKNNDWIGTDAILVQVGDLTDRGPDFKEIIELFIKIRKQAEERGGIVHMLLGNHELFDLQAGYFLLFKSDFDKFGGYLEREKALSMEGKYGELLRTDMNITMIIDDNLFVHSGLSSEFAKRGIDEINRHAHEILSTTPSYDEMLDHFNKESKLHPIFTDPIFDMTNGPLWTKFFIDSSEEEVCKELDKVLKITGTKRMIAGHTIQRYGKITTRCDNKLILIDIALTKYVGNFFGYLEILNDKKEIWTRYH